MLILTNPRKVVLTYHMVDIYKHAYIALFSTKKCFRNSIYYLNERYIYIKRLPRLSGTAFLFDIFIRKESEIART